MTNEREALAIALANYYGDTDADNNPLTGRYLTMSEFIIDDMRESRTVSTSEELIMLPVETVLRGPDWNGEVYAKTGYVEFWGIAGQSVWLSGDLEPRGPFTVLYTPPK